jgi:NarL family two-component system response regulator LiaR
MNETPIRVMVVDDHAVVRSGLGAFLSTMPDMTLVGEAANGDEAVLRCGRLQPDVVLIDLMMPIVDGVTATERIRKSYPATQVIVLTSFQDDALVRNALNAGAVGYLMKNVSAVELANAIRAAHHGRMTLAPEATQVLLRASQEPAEVDALTEREREVLRLMVDGSSNAEVAEKLFISLSTVKYHTSNIFSKLGVDNRVAAVALALQKKLV